MKLSRFLLLWCIVILPITVFPVLGEEKSLHANFGYLTKGFPKQSVQDMQLGYEFITKRLSKYYNVEVNTQFDNQGDTVISLFIDGKLDYLAMPIFTLGEHFSKIAPFIGNIYCGSTVDDALQSYVMLANKTHPTSLKSYAGKRAVLQEEENAKMYMALASTEFLGKHPQNAFNIQYISTPHRAILQLFFDQADIAFVPLSTWETATTMNPAIQSKIAVIHTSPKIYGYWVELLHFDISEEKKERMNQASLDLYRTEEGKQLAKIMKAKSRHHVDMSVLKSYVLPYIRYQESIKNTQKKSG